MEMVIENGRGYVPATEHSPNVQEIGIIPVDAVYSPVVRVRYEIEETRVGQKTNYDRLTHGDLDQRLDQPEMALVESAKILRKHLNPFVQYAELGARGPCRAAAGDHRRLRRRPGAQAEHDPGRPEAFGAGDAIAWNRKTSITVRDLVRRNEDQLLEVRNFGETTLHEVQEKLTELGLRLGMRVPPPSAAV